MKNLKKIVAVLLSMTAIASTTAFATEATYKDGTASLALAEGDITAAANDQLTVVIVPKNAESINSGNIYYINQGAFEAEFTAILADMKVKDGFGEAKDYEVRIGGVKKDGNYAVETFYFKADEPTVLYGDVTGDGKLINAQDLAYLKRHLSKWDGYGQEDINYAAANVAEDNLVNAKDLAYLKRYLSKWIGYETLPQK